MDRQRTGEPPTLLERAGVVAGAGIGGASIAAVGSYAFLTGLSYQLVSANIGANGAIAALFLLLVAVGMSVGGGALLSKALGVSTWQRSTLISAAAHAIGIPLWIMTYFYLTFHLSSPTYFDGLAAFPAATYAFVVPLIVSFSAYRREAPKGLATTLPLVIATVAQPVTALLLESEGIALTSAVVAWVVLPAVNVLGSALIRPRTR
jgi:hypothetical protein